MKIYLAVFASVFMAELGDKTQLATLTYAASPGASPLGVFVAAAAALIVSSALAVLIGSRIERWVSPAQLQLLAGLAFIGIGTWMVITR
jgi:putative Ca2+/H+ antiporter (TMEM165/GDT1 family)